MQDDELAGNGDRPVRAAVEAVASDTPRSPIIA